MPTKSAIIGLCCASMGISRGSEKEKEILNEFIKIKLISIALPKKTHVRRMQDYHTISAGYDRNDPWEKLFISPIAEKTDKGKNKLKSEDKQTILTYRQYLNDAEFMVILSGNSDFLTELAKKLENPVWGVWLGRKNCIPTAPVFAGLFDSEQEIIENCLWGKPFESFTRQVEVEKFEDGNDSLMDQPLNFATPGKRPSYNPRRVKFLEPESKPSAAG